MAAAVRSRELRRLLDLRRFTKNADWVEANREQLEVYADRYVAIDGERIVGVADTAEELYERFAGREDAYITWVEPEGLLWV